MLAKSIFSPALQSKYSTRVYCYRSLECCDRNKDPKIFFIKHTQQLEDLEETGITSQTSTADFQKRFGLVHPSYVSHGLRGAQKSWHRCARFCFELRKCNNTRASLDVFPSFEATNLTKAKGQICPSRTSSDTLPLK